MTTTIHLAASGLDIVVGAATDVGLKRPHNEDALLVLPAVYLVADGMGGYESGDEASRAIVEAFQRVAEGRESLTLEELTAALDLADEGVAEVASRTSRGAGSTVAGAAVVVQRGTPHWVVFNVGDSRVYRHAGQALEQITIDHSLGQELYQAGRITAAEFAVFKERNVITRAIGAADATADSWMMPVRNGERLLLCSDGLTGEVPDRTILEVLSRDATPGAAALELIELAKRAGGRDNISVIVIDVLTGGLDFDVDEMTEGAALARADEVTDESTAPIGVVGSPS
ncbi:MAG TPA: protein phosphatase 2C domain-containing protein [Microbacteriaceae bacterium]|nr:protein phosphatase 2C domain-containing protein [Microbacteriaceae bacterium]